MKRIWALLLVFALVLSCVPGAGLSVRAEEEAGGTECTEYTEPEETVPETTEPETTVPETTAPDSTESTEATEGAVEGISEPYATDLQIVYLPNKSCYYSGEALDVTGGLVEVTWSDGSVEERDMTADMISGFDSGAADDMTLTVTVEGLTAEFGVSVLSLGTAPTCGLTEPHLFTTDRDGMGHDHQVELTMGGGYPCYFYYGVQGNARMLGPQELEVPGIVSLSAYEMEGKRPCQSLSAQKPGSGTIEYDGADYAVQVLMPKVAFCTEPVWDGAYYATTFTAGENTLYLLWAEDVAAPTGVEEVNGNLADLTMEALEGPFAGFGGGYKITFRCSDSNTGWMGLTAVHPNASSQWLSRGSGGGGGYTEQEVDESKPHLYATFWDGSGHLHNVDVEMGGGSGSLLFYYGTQETQSGLTPLTVQDLTLVGPFNYFHNSDADGKAIWINGFAVNDGYLSYRAPDGSEHRFFLHGTLPAYGFYSQPVRATEYLMSGYPNTPGETFTAYVLWNPNGQNPDRFVVHENNWDGPVAEGVEVTFCDGYAVVSFVIPEGPVNGYIFDAFSSQSQWQVGGFSIWRQMGGGGSEPPSSSYVNLIYNDPVLGEIPVRVGVGFPSTGEKDRMALMEGGVRNTYVQGSNDGPCSIDCGLGAIAFWGDVEKENVAPQSFYDLVAPTATFRLVDIVNDDGTSQETPNASLSDFEEDTVSGITTPFGRIQAAPMALFHCTLEMTFTYEGETYTITNKIMYDCPDLYVDCSSLDTAEKLNAVLSSGETMMAWIREQDPEAYENFTGDGFIRLMLPAVTYKDIIVANPTFVESPYSCGFVGLYGSTKNGKQTTIPGMYVGGNVAFVRGITFKHAGRFMEYDGERFSCGLLTDSSITNGQNMPELVGVTECTFRNFDYGIRATRDGLPGSIQLCTIENCTYGFYLDGGPEASSTEHTKNTFVDNTVAVYIRALPEGLTNYRLRFHDNRFIHNKTDILNLVPGKFYFYRNWYGHFKNLKDLELMTVAEEDEYSDRVYPWGEEESRSAIIDEGNVSTVISNPRQMEDGTLGIDNAPGLHSMILNNEAAGLRISGENLAALEGPADITILGKNEQPIAVWTFGGN